MNKSKAGLIVLVFLTAGFFFFLAMLFGSSTQRQAVIDRKAEVEAKYPDAVFAVVIASSLFNHNRELSEITQKAYFSILNGENIASVRFAYDKATDEYWKRHMWDD